MKLVTNVNTQTKSCVNDTYDDC